MFGTAEYIWVDGTEPTPRLRSKIKVVETTAASDQEGRFTFRQTKFSDWNFDGSSTNQADGSDSDVKLRPVRSIEYPLKSDHWLVLCECLDYDGKPHPSNKRARLRRVLDSVGEKYKPWIGFEQEYVIYDCETGRPMGFPSQPGTLPMPQGPYYCGVDGDVAFGRAISEEHLYACLEAGLMIYGTNAEVMPGQWEFQCGKRVDSDEPDPLLISDQLWLMRYMLFKISEKYGKYVSLDCKPVRGDWNGSGMHTNFSTVQMRSEGGMDHIMKAVDALAEKHKEHVAVYGDGLEHRLTGLHETCDIDTFRYGVADRGASIRIPQQVAAQGHGYFEDRRPGANADPYVVSTKLLETVCTAKLLEMACK